MIREMKSAAWKNYNVCAGQVLRRRLLKVGNSGGNGRLFYALLATTTSTLLSFSSAKSIFNEEVLHTWNSLLSWM